MSAIPPRWDARCLNCGSRERHRLLWLWVSRDGGNRLAGKRILHFAPERVVMRRMRGNPLYETADLHQSGVTHTVDITNVALSDGSYDVVIANHVLEHIPDDRQAMRELFRLLRPGGMALLTVPLNASRQQTYENLAITAPAQRHAHFSAEDHVRYYGLDFADRLADAGFTVATFRLTPEEEVQFGLLRDEWLYIATKHLASEDLAVEDLAVEDLAVEDLAVEDRPSRTETVKSAPVRTSSARTSPLTTAPPRTLPQRQERAATKPSAQPGRAARETPFPSTLIRRASPAAQVRLPHWRSAPTSRRRTPSPHPRSQAWRAGQHGAVPEFLRRHPPPPSRRFRSPCSPPRPMPLGWPNRPGSTAC